MLVSTLTTPRELFADLHTVVVVEVHAFAGDDRGWHLLALLERLSHLAGRPLQRPSDCRRRSATRMDC